MRLRLLIFVDYYYYYVFIYLETVSIYHIITITHLFRDRLTDGSNNFNIYKLCFYDCFSCFTLIEHRKIIFRTLLLFTCKNYILLIRKIITFDNFQYQKKLNLLYFLVQLECVINICVIIYFLMQFQPVLIRI